MTVEQVTEPPACPASSAAASMFAPPSRKPSPSFLRDSGPTRRPAGGAAAKSMLSNRGRESSTKTMMIDVSEAAQLGTVKGDIHDIGKNLVAMMLEGAGFEVIDLGINTDVDEYLAALEEHKPDIFGMSALLTTTMPYMKVVIDTMAEQGIRDDYIVLVGGAPLNQEFGDAIGADAYCRDAAVAAETATALVQKKLQTQ